MERESAPSDITLTNACAMSGGAHGLATGGIHRRLRRASDVNSEKQFEYQKITNEFQHLP